jgi:cadmium resistance protein CadD (predicted permease)
VVAGLPAAFGIATLAFVGTNIDNVVVATAMVATAPPHKAHRIAAGQVIGFCTIVIVAVATAIALFDVPTRAIGLLGLVPLIIGLRALIALRHRAGHERAARRAVGSGLISAALVTIAAGGDNLAVYIPLFRADRGDSRIVTAIVFVAAEALVTWFILWAGRHPKSRSLTTRIGAIAAPLLYCIIGVVVLISADTFSFL